MEEEEGCAACILPALVLRFLQVGGEGAAYLRCMTSTAGTGACY